MGITYVLVSCSSGVLCHTQSVSMVFELTVNSFFGPHCQGIRVVLNVQTGLGLLSS
jgi:hypothetical protein